MEFGNLETEMQLVSSIGHVLNCKEFMSIEAAFSVIKNKRGYASMFFWGKIFGKESDYYIAYGLVDSTFEFPSKQFYYAGEDFAFKPFPQLSHELIDRINKLGLTNPFTGNPTTLLEEAPLGEESTDEGSTTENTGLLKLTEAERLGMVVLEIEFDTAVVPNGAHTLSDAHQVCKSIDFKGLGLTEATSLSNYVHFRSPIHIASLRALARTDIQFFSGFLDPIKGDLPIGCWTVRQDASITLVTLRSLKWTGYIAFHVPGTTKFGGVYFGHGQRNEDLPFLL